MSASKKEGKKGCLLTALGKWSHSLQLPTGQHRPDWRSQISPGLHWAGIWDLIGSTQSLWGPLPFPAHRVRAQRSLCYTWLVFGLARTPLLYLAQIGPAPSQAQEPKRSSRCPNRGRCDPQRAGPRPFRSFCTTRHPEPRGYRKPMFPSPGPCPSSSLFLASAPGRQHSSVASTTSVKEHLAECLGQNICIWTSQSR